MQDTIPFLTTIITKAEADEMNPLVLAFVGDSVQQLYVRTRLAISSDKKSGALHKLATKEIKAEAQADKIEKLLPCLSEEEVAVYKRARNAHYSSSAKNASIGDYKKSKRIRGSSRIPVSHGKTRPPERIAFNRIRRNYVNYGKKRSV